MEVNLDRVANLLGHRGVDMGNVVVLTEVGSTMHGVSSPDTDDDLDLMVVRVEPWPELITGPNSKQSMQVRTQPDGHRSRFGDIDIAIYTVRKYVSLLLGGNPTILNTLYSPRHVKCDLPLDDIRSYVVSVKAGRAFMGYMRQQIERLKGERGQKNVNRPELVEKYGYDTKYAYHAARLAMQGTEFLRTGHITLPCPADVAAELLSIRVGNVSPDNIVGYLEDREAELETAYRDSDLPDLPNQRGAERIVHAFYARQYTSLGQISLA